ncbi:hypothetical protein GGQ74_003227 [Desulfobaculum xiamenense]|uniref:Uncharacterized protein n=1 Tax=Desulfobaculum xiamenense TaxID=995050 RepID=A0A846QKP4_9BACT|nr:hypothetical protein [Desulfobaculum xiamenense]NJB69516.1 hypothetical protein [Desulfobaculum xiamenense]
MNFGEGQRGGKNFVNLSGKSEVNPSACSVARVEKWRGVETAAGWP